MKFLYVYILDLLVLFIFFIIDYRNKYRYVYGWFVCILGANGKCVGFGRGCDGEG